MPPDPAGRRSPRRVRGVATVRPAVPATGTVYTGGSTGVPVPVVARVVLAAAGMVTGMIGGGLLFGQAMASWLGV